MTDNTDSHPRTHALRGYGRTAALRQLHATQSVGEVRSHAERGNKSRRKSVERMQMARATAVLMLCLSWMVPSSVWSADVTPEEHKLLEELLAANSKRETLFGNMHAIWTMEEVKDGTKSNSTIEFWSRENKYFRFDETFTQPHVRVERHFATPTRYVRFSSFSPDIRGAVTDHDTVENGRENIRGQGWFCEANKRARQHFESLVDYWLNADNVTLQVRKEEGGGLVITVRTEGKGDRDGQHLTYANSEVLKFSPGDYRFLGSKIRGDVSDGTWGEGVFTKTYSEPPSDIPISSIQEDIESDGLDGIGSGGTTYSVRYTLTEMQFEPAPMEVFELPEFPALSGSNWTRRLVLLLGGAALLAIYFFVRSRKKNQK